MQMKLFSNIGIRTLRAVACLAALASSACNSDFASAVRQVTYPPDFVYVSGEDLRSNMRRLSNQLAQLDDVLIESETRQPDPQEVVIILSRIEQISSSMRAGEAGASHAFLEREMPDFVNEVSRARLAAMMTPPDYYLAGRITGACLNCHRVNRDRR